MYKRIFVCRRDQECNLENSNMGYMDECPYCSSIEMCKSKNKEYEEAK